MSISIELQEQVYQENLDNLLRGSNSPTLGSYKGVPRGNFTHLDGPITQFSVIETPFKIVTDSPGEIHTIRSELISNATEANILAIRNRVTEKTFVPVNNVVTVTVPLLKGENQITISTVNDRSFTSVIATHFGTFLTTYAREIFNSTQNPLNEQNRALFSNFSSRITETLIPFQDLYADPKSLRTLISRFVTRAYMTKNGSTDGVRDFTAALLGTTPIFIPTKTDQNLFEPDVVPLFKSQLEFGGYEAHTWIPNFEITHWLAFLRLINSSRHFYSIEEVGENEILVNANGFPEIHRFDFDDPTSTAYSEFNFTEFRIVVEVLTKLNIRFCAVGYPFDLFVSESNPLGTKRIALDSNIPLDSGEAFDAPSIDPGDDGWIGLTLSGRFEDFSLNHNPIQLALDSLFITPSFESGLPDCVYEGFFTQQISTLSGEIDINSEFDSEGSLSSELEEQTIESFEVDTTIEDFSNISDWSITGSSPGTIESSDEIVIAGTSSIKHVQPAGSGSFPIIIKSYNTPIDLSEAGGKILYFTVYLGNQAIPESIEGIPSHPGNLWYLNIALVDGDGNQRSYSYYKEDLKKGLNILPIMLEYPSSVSANGEDWDISSISEIRISPRPVPNHAGWNDIYLGRLHLLHPQAYFRPARAKIEFEDIDNIAPDSLLGSELVFTDRFGNTQTFKGDDSYNTLDKQAGFADTETVYFPGLYKIQSTSGIGTEGFNRYITALNLQREMGRQLHEKSNVIAAPQQIVGLPDTDEEVFVNIFSKQFSPTGNKRTINLVNPNPYSDLIDFTGFSGGTLGFSERLLGIPGSALAQQFTSAGPLTARFLEIFLYRVGDPVGSITASIHEDDSGKPGTLLERAENVIARNITDGIPGYTLFRLLDDINLSAATDYWIVVSGNPEYFEGINFFESDFDEPFPSDTSGSSFSSTFNNPKFVWVPKEGNPAGSNSGIINGSDNLRLEWMTGHSGVIQSRLLPLITFSEFELEIQYSNLVASNNTGPFVSPDSTVLVGLSWYDTNDQFMNTVGLTFLPAGNPSPAIIDLSVVGAPPIGAVGFRIDFLSVDPDGAATFEGLEIRRKGDVLKGADAKDHVVWAKQSGGYPNPRASTNSGLSFSGANGFWSIESGEHHYFKIIGAS